MEPFFLAIEQLNRKNFRAFGDVIECNDAQHFSINNGNCTRFHNLADIDVKQEGGTTLLNIFRADAVGKKITIKEMEKHPLGSQAFIPMARQPFLIVVAEGDSKPDAGRLRCFVTRGQQGINYARNVWHHPLLALHSQSEFLVIDRGGPGNNCDVFQLPERPPVYIDTTNLEATG